METKNRIWNDRANSYIEIYVPEGYTFDEADISVGAGELNISAINTKELDIDVGAGQAVIHDFNVDYLYMKCGAGQITAAGNINKEGDIDGGIGEIDLSLDGLESDFNYNLNVGVGEVTVGKNNFSGLGSQKTISNDADKDIDVDCGMGSIKVEFTK
ncbi:MAG: DUF4097 family beta strand repeat-containing protein [Suipraeoptans sp.]